MMRRLVPVVPGFPARNNLPGSVVLKHLGSVVLLNHGRFQGNNSQQGEGERKFSYIEMAGLQKLFGGDKFFQGHQGHAVGGTAGPAAAGPAAAGAAAAAGAGGNGNKVDGATVIFLGAALIWTLFVVGMANSSWSEYHEEIIHGLKSNIRGLNEEIDRLRKNVRVGEHEIDEYKAEVKRLLSSIDTQKKTLEDALAAQEKALNERERLLEKLRMNGLPNSVYSPFKITMNNERETLVRFQESLTVAVDDIRDIERRVRVAAEENDTWGAFFKRVAIHPLTTAVVGAAIGQVIARY